MFVWYCIAVATLYIWQWHYSSHRPSLTDYGNVVGNQREIEKEDPYMCPATLRNPGLTFVDYFVGSGVVLVSTLPVFGVCDNAMKVILCVLFLTFSLAFVLYVFALFLEFLKGSPPSRVVSARPRRGDYEIVLCT